MNTGISSEIKEIHPKQKPSLSRAFQKGGLIQSTELMLHNCIDCSIERGFSIAPHPLKNVSVADI